MSHSRVSQFLSSHDSTVRMPLNFESWVARAVWVLYCRRGFKPRWSQYFSEMTIAVCKT